MSNLCSEPTLTLVSTQTGGLLWLTAFLEALWTLDPMDLSFWRCLAAKALKLLRQTHLPPIKLPKDCANTHLLSGFSFFVMLVTENMVFALQTHFDSTATDQLHGRRHASFPHVSPPWLNHASHYSHSLCSQCSSPFLLQRRGWNLIDILCCLGVIRNALVMVDLIASCAAGKTFHTPHKFFLESSTCAHVAFIAVSMSEALSSHAFNRILRRWQIYGMLKTKKKHLCGGLVL